LYADGNFGKMAGSGIWGGAALMEGTYSR